jgi:hypothetical protein
LAKNIPIVCAIVFLVVACGGSNGDNAAPRNPGTTAAVQSAGGIWHVLGGPDEAVTVLIAETGELQIIDIGPAFGAGAVIVNNPDQLAGAYETRGIQASPTAPRVPDASCDIEGTVVERIAIRATVHCLDSDGGDTTRMLNLAYDPAYDTGSSLDDIAGNYTLAFRPQTNMLNINTVGIIFGMLDNGVRCAVNGTVEIIDRNFNLYRFELLLSSCDVRPSFEGATFKGLAFRDAPGLPSGAFLLLATAMIDGRLEIFSLLYEPT